MIAQLPAPSHVRAKKILRGAHDYVFRRVHGSNLVYNAAWEDPRIDRQLLKLNADSRVVMITSAGCNALDYLLDGPAEIHAIDMNYRQNAVLELKLALFRQGDFPTLFDLFGSGSLARYEAVYQRLRPDISASAQCFWDKWIRFFNPQSLKKSFYYHGSSGVAAWVLGKALFRARPGIRELALDLLASESLGQQCEIYGMMEDEIWGSFTRWLVRQPMLMTLLGVPRPQMRLIDESHPGGITAYVRDKLRHVMTALPIAENYFWRVYMTGSYTTDCCPNYLRSGNFADLNERAGRVLTHTCTVTDFLRRHPGQYSHFVLLDHQDWLAWHDPVALLEEWEVILRNSRTGAKILMRSAGLDISFIPAEVRTRLRFHPEETRALHLTDRVGTYGSLHFAEVI